MRLPVLLIVVGTIAGWGPPAGAEYCIDWRRPLQQVTGQQGHCWPTENECRSYYTNRCLNPTYRYDCAGACYFRPGRFPATGTARPPNQSPSTAPGAAGAARIEQHKAVQEAADRERFRHDLDQLRAGGLKAPAPSTTGPALKQLDCVRKQSQGPDEARGGTWTDDGNCRPIRPDVPEPRPVGADPKTP